MAKKKNSSINYQLNSSAVNDLIKANEMTAEDITRSEKEQIKIEAQKYNGSKVAKLPTWLKGVFVKYWASGALCFFFYFGLATVITNQLDLLFVLMIATGILTDVGINNILRFMAKEKGEYNSYMIVEAKGFWTLFVNIAYSIIIVCLVVITYSMANKAIIVALNMPVESVPIAVEPFLYGLVYLMYDMIFTSFKNMIVSAVKKNR